METLQLLPGGVPAPERDARVVLFEVAGHLREQALRLEGSDPWRAALIDIAAMANEEVEWRT